MSAAHDVGADRAGWATVRLVRATASDDDDVRRDLPRGVDELVGGIADPTDVVRRDQLRVQQSASQVKRLLFSGLANSRRTTLTTVTVEP